MIDQVSSILHAMYCRMEAGWNILEAKIWIDFKIAFQGFRVLSNINLPTVSGIIVPVLVVVAVVIAPSNTAVSSINYI